MWLELGVGGEVGCGESGAAEACGVLDHAGPRGFSEEAGRWLGQYSDLEEKLMGLGWLCLEERWPHLSHTETVISIGASV